MSKSNIGLGAALADAARASKDSSVPKILHGTDNARQLPNMGKCVKEDRRRSLVNKLRAAGLLPVTATDLLAWQFPPVEWIVEDLLAARGGTSRGFKGDIIAGSKMRKTFFALQLAASVAAGRDFLGFHVPKARRVLYLNLELREDFTQERMRKIANAIGAPLGNLEIMSPSKPYLLRNRYATDRDGLRKLVEGFEDEFLEYAKIMGFELVVADPQYKLEFPEEDENSGQGIGGILRWRDRIITETVAACVIVHHDPKSGGTDRDLTQRGAGSSFSGRDYDTRMALDANADGDPLHEVLECGSRVRPSPEPVTAVFDTGTFTFSVDETIPAKRLTGKQKRDEQKSDTTSAAARGERERAKEAALKIFEVAATEATARAKSRGGDPAPEDYLLNTDTFESYLAERGSLTGRAAKRQIKVLLGKLAGQPATLASVHELIRGKDGKAKNKSGGVTYIGLPDRVEAYRRSFEDCAQ